MSPFLRYQLSVCVFALVIFCRVATSRPVPAFASPCATVFRGNLCFCLVIVPEESSQVSISFCHSCLRVGPAGQQVQHRVVLGLGPGAPTALLQQVDSACQFAVWDRAEQLLPCAPARRFQFLGAASSSSSSCSLVAVCRPAAQACRPLSPGRSSLVRCAEAPLFFSARSCGHRSRRCTPDGFQWCTVCSRAVPFPVVRCHCVFSFFSWNFRPIFQLAVSVFARLSSGLSSAFCVGLLSIQRTDLSALVTS